MTPPKMPIHIGDYKRDTGHLRAAEHGAYLLLLFHHWSTGGLPTDDRQLSAIACMSPAEWKRARPILERFFEPGWIHGRVVADLHEANEKYEKLAGAGKRGGQAKSQAKRKASEACSQASQSLAKNPSDALATDYRLPIKEDKIGDARAGVSAFTEGSKRLASALWRALGFEKPIEIPPELAGADWRALEWERAGWTEDLVFAEVRRIGPGKSLTYYEKVFATAFAKRQAPLPVVEIRQSERLTVTHGTSQNRSGGSLLAALDGELAQLERETSADLEMPTGTVLRLSQ